MASSDEINVVEILAGLGIPAEQAKQLSNKMNGIDYLNLVNALDDDSSAGAYQAQVILKKYGINLKVPQMENNRLDTIFAGIRGGAKFEDAEAQLTTHVRPISEMDSPIAGLLEASGFKQFVKMANDADAEKLRDWLEEHDIDYQNNDKYTFLVRPSDREQTYRLNKFVANCHGKTSVMDDLDQDSTLANNVLKSPFKGEFGEIIATKSGQLRIIDAEQVTNSVGSPDWVMIAKNSKGKTYKVPYDTANAGLYRGGKFQFDEPVVEEKNKMAKDLPKSRNPIAAGMVKKTGGGAHNSKDPDRKDPFSRKAKHKNSFREEVEINEDDSDRIDEGVLGMTRVDPIDMNRLRQLAGMKALPADAGISEAIVEADPLEPEIEVADDFDDADLDMGSDLDAPVDADAFGSDDDLGLDMGDDLGMDADPMDIGGVPGDLPPVDDMMGGLDVVPTNSIAYDEILNNLNAVQATLGDVKLSEYKSILAKLDILADQIRSMGRDYLGERRRK